MKKYFFGYLFVKIAKLLAVFALVVGTGYAFWKYGQAHLAADSASYRPSDFLQSQLANLSAAAQRAERIVKGFAGEGALGQIQETSFTRDASSNSDFVLLKQQLAQLDQERQQMKGAVTSRFNKMIGEIEEKLRARAAALEAASAPPAASAVASTATPVPPSTPPVPASEKETLYSENLGSDEIQRRTAALEKAKQLLIVLQTAAENPQNRNVLQKAETQLDQLEGLLPPIPQPVQASTPPPTESAPSTFATPTSTPKTFNAEKVANELQATRFQVGTAVLSS